MNHHRIDSARNWNRQIPRNTSVPWTWTWWTLDGTLEVHKSHQGARSESSHDSWTVDFWKEMLVMRARYFFLANAYALSTIYYLMTDTFDQINFVSFHITLSHMDLAVAYPVMSKNVQLHFFTCISYSNCIFESI